MLTKFRMTSIKSPMWLALTLIILLEVSHLKTRMSVVHKHFNGYGWGGGIFIDEYTWSIDDW